MSQITRRTALAGGLAAVGAAGASALVSQGPAVPHSQATGLALGSTTPNVPTTTSSPPFPTGSGVLIGDGSTSDTGAQPRQPVASRLRVGETPPQFVVVGWDGAGATQSDQFGRFLEVARDVGASMTLFLSGIYLVPREKRNLYHGPRHRPGQSDISFFPEQWVHRTIERVSQAWLDGHEIGTHFNGHFCGAQGVSSWTVPEWRDEIAQAKRFVETWRTTTGFNDLPPLPFDYEKELIGGRTPCLQGWANLQLAAAQLGWRYDTSATGLQVWPSTVHGLWNLPMQSVPFPGHSFEVLTMDYNYMYNQSGGTSGAVSMRPTWRGQAHGALMAGFRRAYHGNRAPLVIGNHFETWNGGIYMDAVELAMRDMAKYPDVRLVSFRQLVEWLDAQEPAVLTRLRTLGVGQVPAGGWSEFLGSAQQPLPSLTPSQVPTPVITMTTAPGV